MFASIAPRYDLLNRLLSFGIDGRWRDQAATAALTRGASSDSGAAVSNILDVATGTGDLAFTLARQAPQATVIGIDFAEPMLDIARSKARARASTVTFQSGDGTALEFPDDSFDAVTIAYGLRNFDDIDAGLREFYRVLRPGGRLVVLEFPPPGKGFFGSLFRFYFRRVLPAVGGLVSGRPSAYHYLPASVMTFPDPDALAQRLRDAGFGPVSFRLQTFGVSALHQGEKAL